MHEFSPTFKSPSLNLRRAHARRIPVSGLLAWREGARRRKLVRRTSCLHTYQSTKP